MKTQKPACAALGCPGAATRRIFVQNRGGGRILAVGSINFVEQRQRKVVYRAGGEDILATGRVRDCLEALGASFWLCHSYLAINLERVSTLNHGTLEFEDGEQLYLSKDAFGRAMKAMVAYRENSPENEGFHRQKTTK